MSSEYNSYHGSCLCGGVQIAFTGFETPYVFCHCSSCRKASGSAFAANVAVKEDALTVVSGEDLLSVYESTPGKHRYFCAKCGSPMFNRVDKAPGLLRVRLGCLDTPVEEKPAAHIFVAERAAWFDEFGVTPKFESWPARGAVMVAGSRQPELDDTSR